MILAHVEGVKWLIVGRRGGGVCLRVDSNHEVGGEVNTDAKINEITAEIIRNNRGCGCDERSGAESTAYKEKLI